MQIILDEKGLALLASAVGALLVASWRVSKAHDRVGKIDEFKEQLEKEQKATAQRLEEQDETIEVLTGTIEDQHELIANMATRIETICKYLGISIRISAQRSSGGGQVQPDPPPPPPPVPAVAPAPPRYAALVSAGDPFAPERLPPPARGSRGREPSGAFQPPIIREEPGGHWPADDVPTRPERKRDK